MGELSWGLVPDGPAGYRKGIVGFVGFLGAVLAAIQPLLPPGSVWAAWVGGGVALCAAVGVYLVPNRMKVDSAPPAEPVVVDDEPGKHEGPQFGATVA
jgi:hypothetical protein